MKKLNPALLLQQKRSGLVELEYYGYIVFCDADKNLKTFGNPDGYPFFHRSCAKPLQASIIKDFDTKDFFNLTEAEIAICCASHTGEQIHLDILKSILQKTNLNESDLLCPAIAPLNIEEQKKFKQYSPLHNNCSGKHTLMLTVCQQMDWDKKTYLEKNHPLQIAVYEKIKELCEEKDKLPFTLDGCMAPNWATSLESLTKGFHNLFCNDKYLDIKNSFMSNPYLIGGKDRLDTQIMQMNQKLIAKVGAGGLCSVVNTESNEVLSFKIIDADMKARSIVAIETLIQLDWLNIDSIDENLLKNALNKTVTTETGAPVGFYQTTFDATRMF